MKKSVKRDSNFIQNSILLNSLNSCYKHKKSLFRALLKDIVYNPVDYPAIKFKYSFNQENITNGK